MSSIDAGTLAKWLQTLLEETYGKEVGQPGYMLDRSASGLLGMLDALSVEAASTPIRPETTTIAAQAFHLAFIQDVFIHWMQGDDIKPDWSKSWPSQTTDPARWQLLKEKLNTQHQQLIQILSQPLTQDPLENAALLIAHSAYHLGAIRQINHSLNLP